MNYAALIAATLTILLFQNCSINPDKGVLELESHSPADTLDNGSPLLKGQELYEQKCSSCHNTFSSSVFISKAISIEKYQSALTNISRMSFLNGVLTDEQVSSIVSLFNATTTPGQPTPTSSFICSSTAQEKLNARPIVRLTGSELQASYKANLSTAVWNSLANYTFLLPTDGLIGNINTFTGEYASDSYENISKFNEKVAEQIAASNASLQAFVGSCASTTNLSKTCFDTFMTAKLPRILRTASVAADNTIYWSAVSQASLVADQVKILVQLVFNDPRFLFHVEQGDGSAVAADGTVPLNSYEVANRVSFAMTGAPPDDTLWADAVANKLKVLANVQSHVDRLSNSEAFKAQVVEFFKFYSGTSTAPTLSTNTEFLQGVSTTGLPLAAENDLKEFINYTVFSELGTIKTLFTSQNVFPAQASLAQVYGTAQWTPGANPMKSLNHTGLLSRAFFNMGTAENISYINRAKKLRGNFLCSPPPPPTVESIAQRPEMTEDDIRHLTRRQFLDKATLSAASCLACHSQMNDLAYLTGNYDNLGRYVTTERVFAPTGVKVAENNVVTAGVPNISVNDGRVFNNLVDLQNEFAQNDSLQRCMTRKAVQFFEKRSDDIVLDACMLNKMDTKLKNAKSLKEFFLEKFKSAAILYKKVK